MMTTILLLFDGASTGGWGELLRPVRENWPLVLAAFFIIWHLAGLSHAVKSMARSFKEMSQRVDKRLDSHSEQIDDINIRVAHIEGAHATPAHHGSTRR